MLCLFFSRLQQLCWMLLFCLEMGFHTASTLWSYCSCATCDWRYKYVFNPAFYLQGNWAKFLSCELKKIPLDCLGEKRSEKRFHIFYITVSFARNFGKKQSVCHEIRVRGEKKPLQHLCCAAVRKLCPCPRQHNVCTDGGQRGPIPWSFVKQKLHRLLGQAPTTSEADFQWQAVGMQATKTLAVSGTSGQHFCVAWVQIQCQERWLMPYVAALVDADSLQVLSHALWTAVCLWVTDQQWQWNLAAEMFSLAFHPSSEKGGEVSVATAAHSSGCPRGQAGALCWVSPGEVSYAVLSGQAAQTQTFCPAPTEGWTMAGHKKAEQLQERRQ